MGCDYYIITYLDVETIHNNTIQCHSIEIKREQQWYAYGGYDSDEETWDEFTTRYLKDVHKPEDVILYWNCEWKIQLERKQMQYMEMLTQENINTDNVIKITKCSRIQKRE